MTLNPTPWLDAARAKLGVRETPGPASNPTILGWAKRLGVGVLGIAYGSDDIPWCGLFVAECITEAGLKPPPIAVRAAAWGTWGEEVAPCVGAIGVFKRDGGNHVCFLVGERRGSADHPAAYRVLGGNQSDAVTETWIAKDRMIACRWPAAVRPLGMSLPMIVAGGPMSRNEA